MSFAISLTLNTDIKRMQKKSINHSKDNNKDSYWHSCVTYA